MTTNEEFAANKATEKATKLAFEKHYEDSCGVRAAVRYDSTTHDHSKVEISSGEEWTALFPVDDIDWLIECLRRVQAEL